MKDNELNLYELSSPGRKGVDFPAADVPHSKLDIPPALIRPTPPRLPELSELDVVRHFTRISQKNYSIDTNFYPLGSCTMKYNPRIMEEIASMEGFTNLHPSQPEDTIQGALQVIFEMEKWLAEISGMDAVSLQPAAGAHGELTGMLMVRAYHEEKGNPRKKIIIPDTAHGTNPASAAIAGYDVMEVKTGDNGILHPEAVEKIMDEDVAAIMLTNPNTLGIFESKIREVSEIVHRRGGLVYCDGANLNALMGKALMGDMGVDVIQFNLHKTFATPHGGGGPGSGPVGVKKILEPYLPIPRITKNDKHEIAFRVSDDFPKSIGRVRSFFGNFLVVLRGYAYILSMGASGLKGASELAVLNANYIKARLKNHYHLPYQTPSLHECVFSDKLQNKNGVKTIDIAKRLLDYGFHPPTIYFPLVVHGAIMIEPTETEGLQTIDKFCDTMIAIAHEAISDPKTVIDSPQMTPLKRLDEVRAARELKLKIDLDS